MARYLAQQPDYDIVLASRSPRREVEWLGEVRTVHLDWNSSHSLAQSCRNMDAVVHLAGMNAGDCAEDPVAALAFNGIATGRLVQAAIQQGVRRFIYLSSAHVYASPLQGRITEETCSTNLHPYATSHRAGEDAVRYAYQKGDVEGIVVRLSNAFGPPAHEDVNCWMLLVNALCREVVTSRKMTLRTPEQSRDFVAMGDVCRAIRHFLDLPRGLLGGGIFNVGGQSVSVHAMAERIRKRCEKILGFRPEIVMPTSIKENDVNFLDYRTDRLASTGFATSLGLDEEIDATLLMCQKEWGIK